MRKIGWYRRKKQKKFLILGSLFLLLFLCVGYAAFSTQLSLRAKGNIKPKKAADILKENVVESGDGLYKDIYEDGRYIYKGANPNNYITFNNEMWRIISVEEDGSIKILRNESVTSSTWDEETCPIAYNSINNIDEFTSVINNIIFLAGDRPAGPSGCNLWDRPSDIKTYLNGEYLSTIINNQDKIVSHTWSIGEVTYNNSDLVDQINDENGTQSQQASVGLITVSEYLRANTNVSQCETFKMTRDNRKLCPLTNWMYKSGVVWWTITKDGSNMSFVCNIYDDGLGSNNAAGMSHDIYPSVYLSSNIVITGDGTESVPYQIEN